MARHRAAVKATDRCKMTPEVWAEVKAKLELGWTPEMISERLRRDGKPFVCRELIYEEYYRRQKLVIAGLSDEKLPLLPKRRKQRKTRDRNAKKYSRDAGRGKIRERVDIDQRPKNVLNRKRVGHREGDLINGHDGTGHIVTLARHRQQARSSARFTNPTENCYTTSPERESPCQPMLRNECCAEKLLAGCNHREQGKRKCLK